MSEVVPFHGAGSRLQSHPPPHPSYHEDANTPVRPPRSHASCSISRGRLWVGRGGGFSLELQGSRRVAAWRRPMCFAVVSWPVKFTTKMFPKISSMLKTFPRLRNLAFRNSPPSFLKYPTLAQTRSSSCPCLPYLGHGRDVSSSNM